MESRAPRAMMHSNEDFSLLLFCLLSCVVGGRVSGAGRRSQDAREQQLEQRMAGKRESERQQLRFAGEFSAVVTRRRVRRDEEREGEEEEAGESLPAVTWSHLRGVLSLPSDPFFFL